MHSSARCVATSTTRAAAQLVVHQGVASCHATGVSSAPTATATVATGTAAAASVAGTQGSPAHAHVARARATVAVQCGTNPNANSASAVNHSSTPPYSDLHYMAAAASTSSSRASAVCAHNGFGGPVGVDHASSSAHYHKYEKQFLTSTFRVVASALDQNDDHKV